MAGALVFTSDAPVLAAAVQRKSLDHLAAVARRPYIPGSHSTKAIRETVFDRLPSHLPRALCRQQNEVKPQSFCKGHLFARPRALV